MNIEYREATIKDAAGIGYVDVVAQQVAYREFLPAAHLESMSVSDRTQAWHDFIQSDDPTQLFVAEHEECVVGFVRAGNCNAPDMGYIYDLFVLPDYWGKGVGEGLMKETYKIIQGYGHKSALLYVFSDNARARRFYERLGWSLNGKIYDKEISGETVRFLCYRWTAE